MKAIYTFMIGLILFNFYACSKQAYNPKVNDLSTKSNLEITYLDDKNQSTENPTDTILMKLKDDESGFIMVSRKTGKEDGIEEYTTSLIDTINNTSISMVYTNGADFPHKILLVKGEENMIGYTSTHRRDSQDFDIIWYTPDGYGENSENIPLTTTIYNYIKTPGVDANTDYQIKTIKISVKIADAINKYVEENSNNNIEENNDYNIMLRRITWKDFCKFWKQVFTPVIIAIAVVVAIVVPVFIPAATGIVLGVTGGAIGVTAGLAVLFEQIDNGIQSSPGEKALLITRDSKEDYYQEGEIISLEAGSEVHIYFDILNEPINYLKVKVSMPNDNEAYKSISGYFEFDSGEGYTRLDSEYVINQGTLEKDKDMHLIIKKRTITPIGFGQFTLTIETGNNVMINRGSSSSLKLIFE